MPNREVYGDDHSLNVTGCERSRDLDADMAGLRSIVGLPQVRFKDFLQGKWVGVFFGGGGMILSWGRLVIDSD